MARLTKEQIVEKINQLNEKLNRLDAAYARKLEKIEKDLQKELKKVPYEVVSMVGIPYMVTEEVARKNSNFDREFADKNYEESVQRCKDDIASLESRLPVIALKECEINAYEEMRQPPKELVEAFREIVNEWIADELTKPEEMRYYATFTEEELEKWVICEMAKEVAFRVFPVIGKIHHFTTPNFIYGKIDIYCSNEAGDSCHLTATIVHGHYRTNQHNTTFKVRPHIRSYVGVN